MKKFHHYYQLDQMDCGPACLRMVARHYGHYFSAQSLRERAEIGRQGTSLLGLAEAAETIGFHTAGVNLTFAQLLREAPLPCIIHWQQSHFVVVHAIQPSRRWLRHVTSGFRTKGPGSGQTRPAVSSVGLHEAGLDSMLEELDSANVYIADPSAGMLTYSAEEFCTGWLSNRQQGQLTGIALLLEPTPTLAAPSHEDKVNTYGFARVLRYLLQYRGPLLQLLLGLTVSSGLLLLMPFLTQSVVDVGVATENVPFIYLVLGAQLMLMTGRLIAEFIQNRLLLHISTRVNLNILSDFLIKLLRLPLSFFNTKNFGDLLQRIDDHQRIESFMTGQALLIPFALVNTIVLSLVVAHYSLAIFGIYAMASLLYMGWIALFLRPRRKLDAQRFTLSARSQSSLIYLIEGMQEIKLAGAERASRWSWERLQAGLFQQQLRSLNLGQLQQAGAFLLNDGKNILITCLAAQAVIQGQLTLGAMLAIQQLLGQLNSPISQLTGFAQAWQDARMSMERLNEVHVMTDEEPVDQPLLSELPVGDLYVRNLSFRYPGAGNDFVLRSLNLHIPIGKTTAIVGMSGSGKTTLLKLLLRFYDLTAGEIRLGDASLRYISHARWRTQCGVVMQDGYIFSDTIARNIAVGVERIDVHQLNLAVRIANLREFVDALPSGLHTRIGAEGTGVSQGQRQRILIARAVYKDPRLILFDEATNSLDATNEAVIMHNLAEFFHGRTVVVVAHRLSTVRHADQIVVLDKGQLVEIGTHSELVARRGAYWQLVKNQLEMDA